jgi:hypothetical protein
MIFLLYLLQMDLVISSHYIGPAGILSNDFEPDCVVYQPSIFPVKCIHVVEDKVPVYYTAIPHSDDRLRERESVQTQYVVPVNAPRR